ncbi:thioesterase family protein [Halorubrum salsamenti]|jgi:acyl-CoA thioesterase FadM|uniref:thioesterase family protein n=1 Tax=Halorubrum salsamenti TaxID=2583990 RepID=UPI0011A29E25|nr:acyl-[acyl-carrier-protein] thioesterase [Halorubrum salsamenti]
MRTLTNKRVHFGEFAGPLAHESAIFDWQLIATQELAAASDYPFAAILEDDGIPYAPVVVDASVHRYPEIGDAVNVDATPVAVGESSLDLIYEMTDGDGDPIATIRATHVTIGPDGSALPLPDAARDAYASARVDEDLDPGPEPISEPSTDGGDADPAAVADSASLPSYGTTVSIRSPHVEGAELAYFEEYPRFAGTALEAFVAERGPSVGDMSGEKWPYKLRDWHWEFKAPVPFESELRVDCEVVAVDQEVIRVVHEFSSGGTTNIEGVTEYGCFDRTGEPTTFEEVMLEPFR